MSVAVPVGKTTADRLMERLIPRVESLKIGTSIDPSADYGPLVTKEAVAKVRNYIQLGADEGADWWSTAAASRCRATRRGFRRPAACSTGSSRACALYKEEIFGPVLQIVRAQSFDEAVALPSTMHTATAWRSSPATAERRANSPPRSMSAWSGSMCRFRCPWPTTPSAAGSAALRRRQPARHGRRPLLHQGQDGDGALAAGIRTERGLRHPDDEIGRRLRTVGPGNGLRSQRRSAGDRRDGGSLRDGEIAPNAARWDEEKHFPVDVLRARRRPGLRRPLRARGCRRLGPGAARRGVIEALATGCDDGGLPLDPQHGAWMIDRFAATPCAKAICRGSRRMQLIASYCLTEPGAGSDAASLRTTARARRRRLCARRREGVHLRRGRLGRLRRDGADRRRRRRRRLAPSSSRGHARCLVRRAGAQDGLGAPADRRGHLRAACRPRTGSATRAGLQDRHGGSRWRPAQHRRLLPGRRGAALETAKA